MKDGPGDASRPKGRKALRRPSRGVRIDTVLTSFSNLGIPARIREYSVKKSWPVCVGQAISKKTTAVRLIGQTLYCNAVSSAWLTELNYQKKDIIRKINSAVGEQAVTEIIFRIGKVLPESVKRPSRGPLRALEENEKSFIEKTTENLPDEELKAIIKRAIERSKTW